jgi:hypothetical protein
METAGMNSSSYWAKHLYFTPAWETGTQNHPKLIVFRSIPGFEQDQI